VAGGAPGCEPASARRYSLSAMGQPVTVIEKPSSRAGVVRYELNRSITGMGHERYVEGQQVHGETPAAELARRLFARGGVAAVHVNSSVVTVTFSGFTTAGVKELIEELFAYYRPGVPVPSEADFADT
jgi:hypothetical protein